MGASKALMGAAYGGMSLALRFDYGTWKKILMHGLGSDKMSFDLVMLLRMGLLYPMHICHLPSKVTIWGTPLFWRRPSASAQLLIQVSSSYRQISKWSECNTEYVTLPLYCPNHSQLLVTDVVSLNCATYCFETAY